MQRVYLLLLVAFLVKWGIAQSYDYSIGQHTEKVDSVLHWMYDYEQLGIKSFGTDNLDRTRDWITNKYTQFGYESIYLDTFKFGTKFGYNIIVEKPGDDTTNWIIVNAHYDSVTEGPGANDNGSGVVACLQIAKIIKDIPIGVGIRFIHFSAEEVGLIGSKHYVANTIGESEKIDLVLNLDQIGGTKGADNSAIKCERDEDGNPSVNNALSYLKTDTLATLISTYTTLTPLITRAYSSDYVPFEDSGYVITGLYQASDYPHYHTANDITANIDIEATTEAIKGALAATLYFSRNKLPLSVNKIGALGYSFFPNPTQETLHFQASFYQECTVRIVNSLGQEVLSAYAFPNEPINVSMLPAGIFYATISRMGLHLHQSKLIIAAN